MNLVDANLLLYAYNPRSEFHARSRQWLENALNGPELTRFAWTTLWAFLRITTNPRVFEHPLSAREASSAIDAWLAQPNAGILEPGEHHWSILRRLVEESQASGTLLSDAALAAIAIEHGATLHTTDRDFSRFTGLRLANPIG